MKKFFFISEHMYYQFLNKLNRGLFKKKLILLILFLIILPNILNNHPTRDIHFYDETFYLESAEQLEGFQDASAYSLFYKILSKIWKNPVDRYFSNYLLLVFGFCFVFISIAKNNKDLIIYSIFLSLIVTSELIVSALPFITIFSSILIVWLIHSFFNRQLSLFVFLIFVLAYTRVEYYFLFLSSILFILPITLNNRRRNYKKWIPLLVYLLGFLIAIANNPSTQDRAFIAFCQHYAYSKFQRGLYFDDPWTTCDGLVSQDFGSAGSMYAVLTGNIHALSEHIYVNIRFFFETFGKHLNIPQGVVLLFFIIIISLEILRMVRNLRLRRNFPSLRSLFLFVLLVFSSIGTILYYPRDHYLLQISVVLVFFIRRGAQYLEIRKVKKYIINKKIHLYCLGFVTVVFLLGLFLKNQKKMILSAFGDNCSNVRLIETLKYLKLPKYNVLSPEGGFCIYLGKVDCKVLLPYEKKSGFQNFISKSEVNVIIMSDYYQKNELYRDDIEFQIFLKNQYFVNTETKFEKLETYTCPSRVILVKINK